MSDLHAVERRNRIRVTYAAYAYEILNRPIMSDGEFDALCQKINVNEPTWEKYHDHERLVKCMIIDNFFKIYFTPHTGQWIHYHPFLNELVG